MSGDKQFSLRLDMSKALEQYPTPLVWNETGKGKTSANPQRWGDVVLARKDIPASYHLCCVVDDHIQGITDIVRGQDLYESTSIHTLLQTIFEFKNPNYLHHELVTDGVGRKLSKSEKPAGLRQLRENGQIPEELVTDLFQPR